MEPINSWSKRSKCKGLYKYINFFPLHGNARGKKFCVDCPVIKECRYYALAHNELGIWGGTSKSERLRYGERVTEIIQDLYRTEGLLEARGSVLEAKDPVLLAVPVEPPVELLMQKEELLLEHSDPNVHQEAC